MKIFKTFSLKSYLKHLGCVLIVAIATYMRNGALLVPFFLKKK